jgi:hypothetical protein
MNRFLREHGNRAAYVYRHKALFGSGAVCCSFAHCDYFAAFAVRIYMPFYREVRQERTAKIAKKTPLPSRLYRYGLSLGNRKGN